MIAHRVNDFRPAKSKRGHHQTMIRSLVHTIEPDRDEMLLLETFRVKRSAVHCTGEDVDEGSGKRNSETCRCKAPSWK
jgi:hypothetical protein